MSLYEYWAPTKVKIAALRTYIMFRYAYVEYFGHYVTGALAAMNRGVTGPLGPAPSDVLIGLSLMMAIPSLTIALSLLLPAPICR